MQDARDAGNADRLNRRVFVFRSLTGVAAVAMGTAVATVATVEPARAQGCTDRDPYDPAGGGIRCRRVRRGCTDADPYDPAGGGIRCGRVRRSCTDRDPYDPAGGGRWCRRW